MPLLGIVIFAIGLVLVYTAFTDKSIGEIMKQITGNG